MICDMYLIDGENVPFSSKKHIPIDGWTFPAPSFA